MANWKDGLLILTGGALGLMLAAILEATEEDEIKNQNEKPDAMNLLVSKIQYEAEAALESCESEEEREQVYSQVEKSFRDMQEKLQQKGDNIIADLKSQFETSEKNSAAAHLQNIVDTFQNLSDSLDIALEDLKNGKKFPM